MRRRTSSSSALLAAVLLLGTPASVAAAGAASAEDGAGPVEIAIGARPDATRSEIRRVRVGMRLSRAREVVGAPGRYLPALHRGSTCGVNVWRASPRGTAPARMDWFQVKVRDGVITRKRVVTGSERGLDC